MSSVAYLIAGAALMARAPVTPRARRERQTSFAFATAANGLGGFAYHGLGGSASRWLHDAAVLATLGLVLATELQRRAANAVTITVVMAAAFVALWPRPSAVAQFVLLVVTAAAVAARTLADGRERSGRLLITGALAAGLYAMSRSGGPLCSPDSVFQGHAGWHLLTALMLWWWGKDAFRQPSVAREGDR